MADWDGKLNAPPGMFRVMGEDKFGYPPEEYWVADYKDYEAAKQRARTQVGPMNTGSVYDDQGKLRYKAILKAKASA